MTMSEENEGRKGEGTRGGGEDCEGGSERKVV